MSHTNHSWFLYMRIMQRSARVRLHSQYNTLNELIENDGKLKSANENDASMSTTFETRNQS